jgi:PAS domain S-box-containing protein
MDGSIRVLHVDDDPKFRDMTAEFLNQEADLFEILEASSAAEARERLHEHAAGIDCIVSDYDLPDRTGVELLETVRAEYPDLPFVLFTGKGSEAVARDALRAGATDYLQKQSGTEQYDLLSNRIRNAVDQSRTEQRVVDLDRVRALVGDINQALVRADSASEIETTVCDLFSESDPYVTACIAGVDTETMQIEPRTWAGADREYFERLDMTVSDDAPGRQAPGGRAYHDREVAVSQDIRNDPQYEPWRDIAVEQGFESLAVVPLEYDGAFYGLLAIFAARPHMFDESETEILMELGDDIAHALDARETRADLRQTASRLQALFEQSPDMINVHDADGNLLEPNPKLSERTGYAADELSEMKVWELDRTIDREEAFALWERMEVGDSHRLEGIYRCRDGSTFPVEVHVRRLTIEGSPRFVAISRDITERKERERERNRRIDLFEKAQDIGDVGAWEYDVQTDTALLSDEVYRIHGLPTDAELTPERSIECYHPDDRPRVREAFERAIEDGETYDLEARLRTDDGERWVRTRGDPQTEAGAVRRVRGTVKDITERKQRQQRLERTVERVTDAIIEVDSEWRLTFVDETTEELYDVNEDDLLGRRYWNEFTEARDTRFEAEFRRVMDSREPTRFVEYAPRLGGWVDVQVYPDDGGGISIYYQHVTDRISRERTLDRYESIIDRLPVGVFRSTLDGEFTDVNPEFVSLTGADSTEELLTTDAGSLYADPERRDELVSRLRQEETVPEEEIQVETRSGDSIWVSVTLALTEHDDQQYIEGICQDITERKRRERELTQAEMIFQQAQDALFLIDVTDDGFEIRRVNRAYEELTGLSIDDIRGKTPREIVGDEAGAEIESRYQQCVDREVPIEYDEQLPIPGAETHWHTTLAPIIEGDEVAQLVGATRDITPRQAAKRDRQRYETVLNTVPDGAYILDGAFEFRMVNDALTELTGYSRDELLGAHASLILDDALIETGQQNRERLQNGHSEHEQLRTEIETADGDTVPCEIRGGLLDADSDQAPVTAGVIRDMTAQRAREQQLEALFENSPDMVYVLDSTGEIREANSRLCEELGYEEDELVGRGIWTIDQLVDEDELNDLLSTIAEGERQRFDGRYERRDGSTLPVEVHRLQLDLGGEPRYLAISRDITERREQERKREQIISRVTDAIVEVDADWQFTLVNDQAEALYDVRSEALLGQSFWEVFAQAKNTRFEDEYREVMQTREPTSLVEYYSGLDGWFDIQVYPNDDGGLAFYFEEITERQRREQALAESEARYRTLAENFPNGGVFFFDDELRYQHVSGSGFAPIGTGPDDLVGNTIYEVEPYSEETIELLEPVMQATLAGNEETIELSYEEHAYRLRSVPIRDDGEVIAGLYITQDITERREREQELQRRNERLEKFTSIVSHDLRNPLNMVEGRLELARSQRDSEQLTEAGIALERCQTLVDDLLTLAREGQRDPETEPVPLGEVAERCRATVETGDATLDIDADRTVVADRSRLQQLLENLIRNAIEHGGSDVTIEVGALEDGFYVADDGPGIPAEDREQVFESAYSTVQDNTGFGLAIVSEIVDSHDWDIAVTASDSGGARFEITGVEAP